MKVCTDACLFGASLSTNGPLRILDVGCGTGLLSVMMAQRNPLAQIDAIEPHQGSYLDAQHNIKQSPWADRIRVYLSSYQDWLSTNEGFYDRVVCNPPFFFNHLSSPSKGRNQALHLDENEWGVWLSALSGFLKPGGHLHLLLSANAWQKTVPLLDQIGLHPAKVQVVLQRNEKPFRVMADLSAKLENPSVLESQLLYKETGGLSNWAIGLLKDFYLVKK